MLVGFDYNCYKNRVRENKKLKAQAIKYISTGQTPYKNLSYTGSMVIITFFSIRAQLLHHLDFQDAH